MKANPILESLMMKLDVYDKKYIEKILDKYNGMPDIHSLWKIMDDEWLSLNCSSERADEKIKEFYGSQVWILNGIFTETDSESIKNRNRFVEELSNLELQRVADYGGGFGATSRELAKRNSEMKVELIEPFTQKITAQLCEPYSNLVIQENLSGHYDGIIAIDVFEHLFYPVDDLISITNYLKVGGYLLAANNFFPVVLSHLPQNYHLRYSFDAIMKKMGFKIHQKIEYATLYKKLYNEYSILDVRRLETRSKQLFSFIERIPKGKSIISKLLFEALH